MWLTVVCSILLWEYYSYISCFSLTYFVWHIERFFVFFLHPFFKMWSDNDSCFVALFIVEMHSGYVWTPWSTDGFQPCVPYSGRQEIIRASLVAWHIFFSLFPLFSSLCPFITLFQSLMFKTTLYLTLTFCHFVAKAAPSHSGLLIMSLKPLPCKCLGLDCKDQLCIFD